MAATAGGSSHEIYLWRLADASSLHRLAGKGHAAWSAGWSPDGKSIAWGNTFKFASYNDWGPWSGASRWRTSNSARRPTPPIGGLGSPAARFPSSSAGGRT